MDNDIYDPLTEYQKVFRDRFKRVAEQTFDELAKEADVDVKANRITCSKICSNNVDLSLLNSQIFRWKVWGVLLIIAAVAGIVAIISFWDDLTDLGKGLFALIVFADVVFLFKKVSPQLSELKSEREDLCNVIDELTKEAWNQMAPLNRLYDWDILARMISKTVPRLEFDPYFTAQRLADLQKVYKWDDSFNSDRSVIYANSGLINGNPFVLCRTRKMIMGTKIYTGRKTIYWTTRERDSDGKYRTVRRSEVLTASVEADYPEYYEKTRLIYGNTAAPDLIFSRKHSGLAGKEHSLSFKFKKFMLHHKAQNLSKADYAMMTNEEFEVAFDTSNRNSNQQFALLFTPLAQENMLKLLKDDYIGYGDDFDFDKHKMINIITPEHLQKLDLDMNPQQYRSFDFDKAKKNFNYINTVYFRAIYFSLAPLLCVPMYQQIRPRHEIYGREAKQHSSFWEHEALANFWGQKHFQHPRCVTKCILKTEQSNTVNDSSTITVHAYGYSSTRRLTYVKKYGGDGKYHSVPVYWDEYNPVTGTGQIYIKEDNDMEKSNITQQERVARIDKFLNKSDMKRYRRHIASKI